jgi:hypothetical protein
MMNQISFGSLTTSPEYNSIKKRIDSNPEMTSLVNDMESSGYDVFIGKNPNGEPEAKLIDRNTDKQVSTTVINTALMDQPKMLLQLLSGIADLIKNNPAD